MGHFENIFDSCYSETFKGSILVVDRDWGPSVLHDTGQESLKLDKQRR